MSSLSFRSPIGWILISGENEVMHSLSLHASLIKIEESQDSFLIDAKNQIEAYFKGDLQSFNINLNLNQGTEFQQRVWQIVKNIPYGKTISYSELAILLGDIKCIRAAGTANGKNPIPIIVPCHRVIGSNGNMVGYALGIQTKEHLLNIETKGAIGKQLNLF